MKNIKVQEKSGDCGLYNLANILQDADILKYTEKVPCGLTEVNEIMGAEGYSEHMFIPVVTAVTYGFRIPIDMAIEIMQSFPEKSSDPECFSPFILNVMDGDSEFDLHAISVLLSNTRCLSSDPRDEGFVEVDKLEDVFSRYKYINSIACLSNKKFEYLGFNKNYVK